MEVLGKIKVTGKEEVFGSKGFRKRELVITTDEQYPQNILIEFIQDKCDLLDSFKVGDSVKVNINLRGREWINPQGEAKYFNSIQGWRIDASDVTAEASQEQNLVADTQSDDLPF
jgi:translation initiation factor IF-3